VGQIGSVYKQPETEEDDSCHSWRVPSKWKGAQRGAKGTARGARGFRGGARENAPCIYVTIMCMQKNN
jgi:hypothetical protein